MPPYRKVMRKYASTMFVVPLVSVTVVDGIISWRLTQPRPSIKSPTKSRVNSTLYSLITESS